MISSPRHLLLLGGGHAHLAVIERLGSEPPPGVHVTLVSRDVLTPYSGMIPGYIAGLYRWEQCHIDLAALCRRARITLRQDSACALDPTRRRVDFVDGPPLYYDWLSIDTGAASPLTGIEGAEQFGIAAKPIDRLLQQIEQLVRRLQYSRKPLQVAVVGGGAASIELMTALYQRCQRSGAEKQLRLRLVSADEQLLPGHNRMVRRFFHRRLAALGATIHTSAPVTAASAEGLTLANGQVLPATEIIWATGAGAPRWLADSGLDCDRHGFIRIGDSLQSNSHPDVFAAGDVAHFTPRPLAKSGVHAVRQGPVLAHNLLAATRGHVLRRYRPQRHFLSLLLAGDREAVASRGWLYLRGRWVWRWKDRIDRRFVARYGTAQSGGPSG